MTSTFTAGELLQRVLQHGQQHGHSGDDADFTSRYARCTVAVMKNASGGLVPRGTPVVASTVNPSAFTTSATQDDAVIGVALEAIAATGFGLIATSGVVDWVLTTAGASQGQYLRQSTTSGQADGTAALTPGSFGYILTSRDATTLTSSALIHPSPKLSDAVLARITADQDVVNTTVETLFFNPTIFANQLGTNLTARAVLHGDLLYNNSTVDTVVLRVKLGGVNLIDTAAFTPALSLSASRRSWRIEVEVSNRAVTNAQLVSFFLTIVETGTAPTTGGGFTNTSSAVQSLITNTGAADTTTAGALGVSVQWSAASVNDSWRIRQGTLELL